MSSAMSSMSSSGSVPPPPPPLNDSPGSVNAGGSSAFASRGQRGAANVSDRSAGYGEGGGAGPDGGGSSEFQRMTMRSSVTARTLSFFRGVLGRRTQEYVTDTQFQRSSQLNIQSGSIGAAQLETVEENPPEHQPPQTKQSFCAPSRRQDLFRRMLSSSYWKFFLILFTVILLFGSQLRVLGRPSGAWDDAFDWLFMATLVFFAADILMRIDAERNYFSFTVCGRGLVKSQDRSPIYGHCQLGSFLFWCDFISALTLLREISFIDPRSFEEQHLDIVLGPFGVPKSGLAYVNQASPIDFSVDLLLIIGRSARVARFIRSSTAVKISSKVNWYMLVNIINPLWWFDQCRLFCSPRLRKERRKSASLGSSSTGGLPSEVTTISRDKNARRRSKWGSTVIRAAVRQDSYRKYTKTTKQTWFRVMTNRVLKMLGLPNDFDEWNRQVAAITIQRAWRRNRNSSSPGIDATEEFNVAWKGSGVHLEKPSMKRAGTGQGPNQSGKGHPKELVTQSSESPEEVTPHVKRRNESQVGSAMRELTGQRVAIGILVALVLTVLFTYTEKPATQPTAMIVLHTQTSFEQGLFANKSLQAAINSSIPRLYRYQLANGEVRTFQQGQNYSCSPGSVLVCCQNDELRQNEIMRIAVSDNLNKTTVGCFSNKNVAMESALISLLSTIFILFVWLFGVTAFAGPVMILVVVPIERMVRLLGMLMLDPLGYQGTARYRRFVAEEDEITKNTRWTKEVLKGMETSFLMSTILRIGSLMKVGFGSAGVEIIRSNLQKGQEKNMLMLSSQGSTVSCIFLFCDIRQFTDATECLQEEVFVFTNRIAAVVHSFCASYGGSANKNIGDAFLCSWLLDESQGYSFGGGGEFTAKNNQADKALLSVVKICMALHHDDYYLDPMSETARDALLAKLKGRKGPVVQMGCGLHAGKAVQGAIGSTRKIDATYVSEAVERAEFLESSTKQYGVKVLMSDSFHRLLHPNNRRRCRKVDQIIIKNEDDESDEDPLNGEIVELLTFDMDIDALWKENKKGGKEGSRESESDANSEKKDSEKTPARRNLKNRRRSIISMGMREASDELSETMGMSGEKAGDGAGENEANGPPELVLPTGPALYNANVWVSEEMRRMRHLYTDGLFFQKFNSGLQAFYSKDWDYAKECFTTILDRFEDGPSRYFMTQIEEHNGKPPWDFLGYGIA